MTQIQGPMSGQSIVTDPQKTGYLQDWVWCVQLAMHMQQGETLVIACPQSIKEKAKAGHLSRSCSFSPAFAEAWNAS